MTKKLTIYLLKKFVVHLFFAILAWITIFVVINMIEQISKFIDWGITIEQFVLYYVYFIPYIISLTLPICMLLAALFSVSNLAQNNEIVAQLSSGISLYRIINPLLILALFISVLAGIFNEEIVPVANQKRLDLERYDMRKNPRNRGKMQNNISVQDNESRKMVVKFFNGQTNVARGVSIQTVEEAKLTQRIDAQKMYWQDSVWKIEDARIREFYNDKEKVHTVEDTVILDSRIKPENLVELQQKPEEMSYSDLNVYIEELREIGADPRKWIVERHLKISLPFANFIVVLIGAPFASRKRRGGTGLNFGVSLLISFIFFILVRFRQVLGHQGTLEPLLAAWLGNIVFFVLGLYTFLTIQK